MEIKFCDMITEKTIKEWNNSRFVPAQGDIIIIENVGYSIINRVWIDKDRIVVYIERIPRG